MIGEGSALRQESGLLSFNPPNDAEPQNGGPENHSERLANGEDEVPTVLTKLQKWASSSPTPRRQASHPSSITAQNFKIFYFSKRNRNLHEFQLEIC